MEPRTSRNAVLAIALLLSLAGCGGDEGVAEAAAENSQEQESVAAAIRSGRLTPLGPFFFNCSEDPGDRLVASFYATEPAAMVAEYRGEEALLFQTISGSGARYVSGSTSFWEHQGEVTLEWGDPPATYICAAPPDPGQ